MKKQTTHPKGGMGSGMRHAKDSGKKHRAWKWQLGGEPNRTNCNGCRKNVGRLYTYDNHKLCEACLCIYAAALAKMGIRNPL